MGVWEGTSIFTEKWWLRNIGDSSRKVITFATPLLRINLDTDAKNIERKPTGKRIFTPSQNSSPQMSTNYKGGNILYKGAILLATWTTLSIIRRGTTDITGSLMYAMRGIQHQLCVFCHENYNLKLTGKRQTNPEFRTFHQTTGLSFTK